MRDIPVYLFTGMLDSGKSTYISQIIGKFAEHGRTLLILCEEGEKEFEKSAMKNTDIVVINEPEELNTANLTAITKKYNPKYILLEYNGMWPLENIYVNAVPKNWILYQNSCFIDATTFSMFYKNMPQQIMEKIKSADMIVFNRCTPKLVRELSDRNLRMVNRMATIYLQYVDGKVDDYRNYSNYAFDVDQPLIDIPDDDFGAWFVEILDDVDRYVGKEVRYKGILDTDSDFGKYIAVGRIAMTCCEEDMVYLGVACEMDEKDIPKGQKWVEITGTVKKSYWEMYEGDGPVIKVDSIKPAKEPGNPVIMF